MTRRPPDVDWMDDAACRGEPVDLWFPAPAHGRNPSPAEVEAQAHAAVTCRSCPVSAECASFVEAVGIVDGLWAGRWASDLSGKKNNNRSAA